MTSSTLPLAMVGNDFPSLAGRGAMTSMHALLLLLGRGAGMALPVSWLLQIVPSFPADPSLGAREECELQPRCAWVAEPPGMCLGRGMHGAPRFWRRSGPARCVGVLGGSRISPANSCCGHLPCNTLSGAARVLGATPIDLLGCKDKAPKWFAGDFLRRWWSTKGVATEEVLATQGCGLRRERCREERRVSQGVVLWPFRRRT